MTRPRNLSLRVVNEIRARSAVGNSLVYRFHVVEPRSPYLTSESVATLGSVISAKLTR